MTAMSGGGATFHFPGAGPSASVSSVSRAAVPDSEDRKQPLYLAGHHGQRQGERERGRGAIAPPAHVQPIALTTTRAGRHRTRYTSWFARVGKVIFKNTIPPQNICFDV